MRTPIRLSGPLVLLPVLLLAPAAAAPAADALSGLPPLVAESLRREAAGGRVEATWRVTAGGRAFHVARIRRGDRPCWVRLAEDGALIKGYRPIAKADLPAAVASAMESALATRGATGSPLAIDRYRHRGVVLYEALVGDGDGLRVVRVSEDGGEAPIPPW